MKFLRYIFLATLLFHVELRAADRITASVTFTNYTSNYMTFTLNSATRTWTNSVTVSSLHVLTNTTGAGSKTNLYSQVSLNPFPSVTMLNGGASNIQFVGSSGLPMSVTIGGATPYAYVIYTTQAVSTLTAVRVPVSGEATAAVRTNIGSGLVAGIEDYSTNSFNQNSTAMSEMAGLTNSQTLAGVKRMTNAANYFRGTNDYSFITNASAISGSNGLWWNGILETPTFSNTTTWGGAAFKGTADFANNISFNGYASYINGESEYFIFKPETGGYPVTLGNNSPYNGVSAYDGMFTNSVTTKTATITNLVMRGPSYFANTNHFPAGSDISFGRYAITTLANGANSVSLGTNVFIQVSGPSAAFTINGMDAQPNRDGALRIILNLTTYNMTIAHDSGTEPTAANRIYTMTGADHATTGNGCAMFIYSASASRWILINLQE